MSEAAEVAADQQRWAEQIRRHLERGDHPVTIKLRILRAEADLRWLRRNVRAAKEPGDHSTGRHWATAAARAQEIDLDRAVLAELAARGQTRDWGPQDFQPSDLVQFHWLGWYPVRAVSMASLTDPPDR